MNVEADGELRPALGLVQPRTGAPGGAVQHGARLAGAVPDSGASGRDKPLSPSFVSNLAKDGIELVYTDEFGSGLGKMPKTNFAPRLDAAYKIAAEGTCVRTGYGLYYGAFENRGGNPSLGYNYPFQFTLRLRVAERRPRRTGCRMDRSSASMPATGSSSIRSTSTRTA